jgi:hypothetical protein
MTEGKQLSRLAVLIGNRVEELKGIKSQGDIARAAGYPNVNMISMIKQGHSKVALDKASALGRALEVDPKEFMLLALEQFYSREVTEQILKDLGLKIRK